MIATTKRPQELGYTEDAGAAQQVAAAVESYYGIPCKVVEHTTDRGGKVYSMTAYPSECSLAQGLMFQAFVAGALAIVAHA